MSTTEQLRADMVTRLVAGGSLRSRPWIAAFTQVPRHIFLPRFFRQSDDLSGWEAVDVDDPGALEMIYTDTTWVTQLDNDPHRWQIARTARQPVSGVPTSSSTAPGLMALMLEALDVHDGHRSLEVGTGSGYNAALLCHRLSPTFVTTVEIDPVVAEAAHAGLRACGCVPTVAVTDGTTGYPDTGPYDRLIATYSTPAVPPAWIAQLRPGGWLLTGLHRDLGGGPLVLLSVHGDGRAEGRFLPDYGGFMPARSHPPADTVRRLTAALASDAAGENTRPTTRPTTLPPDVLNQPDFGMIAALRLPGVAAIEFTPDTGTQQWLLADDDSVACLDETTGTVTQHGNRHLWDRLEDLHRQWIRRGAPARERLGLSVTPAGEHRFWLDSPQAVWWTEPGTPAATAG